MEVPWTVIGSPGTCREAVVMASRFELTAPWRTPAFLAHAMRLYRQARNSPGILGLSLRAQPLHATFWTLSAWADEAAVSRFARTEPHAAAMRKIRPWMKRADFRFWAMPADRLEPRELWAEAEARIAVPQTPQAPARPGPS